MGRTSEKQRQKNAQARARTARVREIMKKPLSQRTAEERAMVEKLDSNRQRKNERSKVRFREIQAKVERLCAMPKEQRSEAEQRFLDDFTERRERKIQKDRDRRKALKVLGTSTLQQAKASGMTIPIVQSQNGSSTTTTTTTAIFPSPQWGAQQSDIREKNSSVSHDSYTPSHVDILPFHPPHPYQDNTYTGPPPPSSLPPPPHFGNFTPYPPVPYPYAPMPGHGMVTPSSSFTPPQSVATFVPSSMDAGHNNSSFTPESDLITAVEEV